MGTHGGFFSYLLATATAAEYYTTVGANEVISFATGAAPVSVSSLLIENTGAATMYIKPGGSKYILCIPAGESRQIDNLTLPNITVMGALGQTLRYSGCKT